MRDQDRVVVLWGEQPSLAHVPLGLRAIDDPVALGGRALALLLVCAAACIFPARRAARADPAVVPRAD